jgi:4-amino-4-deoxy-L-arabinose transferase-like glycosyltransferase
MRKNLVNSIIVALGSVFILSVAAWGRNPSGIEFRTALFVRTILREGPSLIPRLYGMAYYDYPPLYFLCAAASARLFGVITALTLALPSIIAAGATIFLVMRASERVGPSGAWRAGLALLATPLFFVTATQAMVDMTLVFFVSLSLFSFYSYYRSGRFGMFCLCCMGLAGGAATKGPIGVVLPVLIIASFLLLKRDWRMFLIALLGFGTFILLLGTVTAGVVWLKEGFPALKELADAQVFDRVTEEGNQHLFYYLGVFFAGFAPWSWCALCFFRRGTVSRERDFTLFLKVWLIVTFIVFTAARMKHTRYLLPLAPPTAILGVLFWEFCMLKAKSGAALRFIGFLRAFLVRLLAAGVILTACMPLGFDYTSSLLLWLLPLGGAVSVALLYARYKTPWSLFERLVAVIVFALLAYCQFGMPYEYRRQEAREFTEMVEREAGGTPIVFFGIDRDRDGLKYAFWSDREAALRFAATNAELQELLRLEAPAVVVMPAKWRERFKSFIDVHGTCLLEGALGKKRCVAVCIDGGG